MSDSSKKNEELKELVKPKKTQKVSVSYTLKAFKKNYEKLYGEKLVTEADKKSLGEITARIIASYIANEFK